MRLAVSPRTCFVIAVRICNMTRKHQGHERHVATSFDKRLALGLGGCVLPFGMIKALIK